MQQVLGFFGADPAEGGGFRFLQGDSSGDLTGEQHDLFGLAAGHGVADHLPEAGNQLRGKPGLLLQFPQGSFLFGFK